MTQGVEGMENDAAAMESNPAVPQTLEHNSYLMTLWSDMTSGLENNPNRQVDQQNVVPPSHKILFDHKKERNTNTSYNMDEP